MTLPFILIIPAVLAVILAAVLTAEIHRELHTFCVTRYEVSSEKLPDGADVKIFTTAVTGKTMTGFFRP